MSFQEAFALMLNGYKVTRPSWKGYWYINNNKQLVIHLASGEEITTGHLTETIMNTFENDWLVYKEE